MSDEHVNQADAAEPDPNEGPFKAGPIEGMPYKRGSEEDLAIRRIIERAQRERAK